MTSIPRTEQPASPEVVKAQYYAMLRNVTLYRFARLLAAKVLMGFGFSLRHTAQILKISPTALAGERGMITRFDREGMAGLVPMDIPPFMNLTPLVIDLSAALDAFGGSDMERAVRNAPRRRRNAAKGR